MVHKSAQTSIDFFLECARINQGKGTLPVRPFWKATGRTRAKEMALMSAPQEGRPGERDN